MKKFRIQNVSGGILWCLFIITIVVFAAFFFGGEADPANRLVADTSYSEPAQTDTLLYWVYFLIIAAIVVTVLFGGWFLTTILSKVSFIPVFLLFRH